MLGLTQNFPPSIRWLAASMLIYSATGFCLLPYWLKTQLPPWLTKKTNHALSFQAIQLNPFNAKLTIDSLKLADDQQADLIQIEKLIVNIDVLGSILSQSLSFDQLQMIGPHVHIEHNHTGQFNFSQLLAKNSASTSTDSQAQSNPIALQIDQLNIENGQLVWLELPDHGPQSETLVPLDFSLLDFNSQLPLDSQFNLQFKLASGGDLHWQGIFSLAQLNSRGTIECHDIALNKIWQMFGKAQGMIEIASGKFDLTSQYSWNDGSENPALKLDQTQLQLRNLQLVDPNQGEVFIDDGNMTLNGIALETKQQSVQIAKVNWQAKRTNIKSLNQQRGNTVFEIQNWHTELTHFNNLTRPFTWRIDGLWFEQGSFDFQGETLSQVWSSQIHSHLQNLKLKALQPWLKSFYNLELIDGELSLDGDWQLSHSETTKIRFQGDASLSNLVTRDNLKHKDFLKWNNLAIQKIDFDPDHQTLRLNQVLFEQPYLRVTINKDGSSNFAELTVKQTSKADQPVKTSPPNTRNLLAIEIENIQFNAGETDFTDNSLLLPFTTHIKQLNGGLKDLKSNRNQPAKLNLQGRVFDSAQVRITGQHTLQSGDSDIQLNFTHMPLPLITPYMAEFSGYSIEKGQMALDLEYSIHHGELNAQNKLFIDQLALGEHIENPNARSLPIKLAIALLKDNNGKINLNFPISGSLDDPHFNFDTFIADAAGNLISKIAASPFAMFGSLLDSSKDYSVIMFNPGSTELSPEQQQKLAELAKALKSKPQLSIDIKGLAYQDQDWPVIRFDSIYEILKKMKSGELRDQGQQIRHEYIELSDAEYRRLLIKFFKEVYPDELGFSLLGKPKVKSQPDAEFFSLAKQKLELAMPPEHARLNNLAIARANSIAKFMIEQAEIDRDRIFILATEVKQLEKPEINAILTLNAGS